jgi:ectoine hydroxylase-related dioxygenase (phytanoyl-CoA dioxygenase family)
MTTISPRAQARISPEQVQQFHEDGYCVVDGLFAPAEIDEIEAFFEEYRTRSGNLFDHGSAYADIDPAKRQLRAMHPHRYSQRAQDWMLHPEVGAVLEALLGKPALGVQTMYYFKPPGARGQAMHQDNLYLLVDPGTCIAAWTAVDRVDRENGCMMVVPGSHRGNILCQEDGGAEVARESFTGPRLTRIPQGLKAVEVPMEPGDTLFFGGSVIHGSGPNRSENRFRRSFIGHYAAGSLEKISQFYLPLVRMDGSDFDVAAQKGGGACGQDWVGSIH